jgi:glutaredoxin-like YruB-family protein
MKGKSKITVYSTPACPYCHMVKEFLSGKGVKFESLDVSADGEAAERMIKKSGFTGVPQIEINGKTIVGFDRTALERELKNL